MDQGRPRGSTIGQGCPFVKTGDGAGGGGGTWCAAAVHTKTMVRLSSVRVQHEDGKYHTVHKSADQFMRRRPAGDHTSAIRTQSVSLSDLHSG